MTTPAAQFAKSPLFWGSGVRRCTRTFAMIDVGSGPCWRSTMRESKGRLRATLDSTQAPDMWAEPECRPPGELAHIALPRPRVESRMLVTVVALAIFVVAAVFAWSALRPAPRTTQPLVTPSKGPSPVALPVTVTDFIG